MPHVSLDVINRTDYPSERKAIFFDLSLKPHGKIEDGLKYIAICIGFILFGFTLDIAIARILMQTVSIGLLLYPFVSTWMAYNSKLVLNSVEYKIVLFNKYVTRRGTYKDIYDVYPIDKWNGSCWVQTKGIFGRSGFVIYYKEVPKELESFQKNRRS